MNRIPYKNIYHSAIKYSKSFVKEPVKCRNCQVNQEHFYGKIKRKMIKNNKIQFQNTRYSILSDTVISRGTEVFLYYDYDKNPIYILYQDTYYQVKEYQKLQSRKGNSKYN